MLFWAKWCSRSKKAMRHFNDFALKTKSLGRSTVFLAVNLDDFQNTEEVRDYIKESNLTSFRHVISGNGSNDETALAFKAFVIPRFFVISPDGLIKISTKEASEVEEYLAIGNMKADAEKTQLGLIVPEVCAFEH